jgi:probable HAF family extracellular repeat protein
MFRSGVCTLVASLAISGLGGTAHAVGYTLTALGDLPGGSFFSVAKGINDAGQVVGYSDALSSPITSGRHGFIWDAINGMQDLGDLPGGNNDIEPIGINSAGQVVGHSRTRDTTRAFLWDAVNGMQEILDSRSSYVSGINDAGQVVGRFSTPAGRGRQVFLWDAADGVQELGFTGIPNGINNAGQVVGRFSTPAGSRGFLWDAVDGMQELGFVPEDYYGTYVNDINNTGQVVGYNSNELGLALAFSWDSTSGMQELGYFPGGFGGSGYLESVANGINDAGQVVGYSDAFAGARAVVWDAINGMQDLNDMIDPGLSAVLDNAFAINSSGQIVGYGQIDGYTQAFLLTPLVSEVPVPATLVLMFGGIGALVGVARYRKAATPQA